MGLRSFLPQVCACPGCGRTTSTFFQEMAQQIQGYLKDRMPELEGDRTRASRRCASRSWAASSTARASPSTPTSASACRARSRSRSRPSSSTASCDHAARRRPGRRVHRHPRGLRRAPLSRSGRHRRLIPAGPGRFAGLRVRADAVLVAGHDRLLARPRPPQPPPSSRLADSAALIRPGTRPRPRADGRSPPSAGCDAVGVPDGVVLPGRSDPRRRSRHRPPGGPCGPSARPAIRSGGSSDPSPDPTTRRDSSPGHRRRPREGPARAGWNEHLCRGAGVVRCERPILVDDRCRYPARRPMSKSWVIPSRNPRRPPGCVLPSAKALVSSSISSLVAPCSPRSSSTRRMVAATSAATSREQPMPIDRCARSTSIGS